MPNQRTDDELRHQIKLIADLPMSIEDKVELLIGEINIERRKAHEEGRAEANA